MCLCGTKLPPTTMATKGEKQTLLSKLIKEHVQTPIIELCSESATLSAKHDVQEYVFDLMY